MINAPIRFRKKYDVWTFTCPKCNHSQNFDLSKNGYGEKKLKSGLVWTCCYLDYKLYKANALDILSERYEKSL